MINDGEVELLGNAEQSSSISCQFLKYLSQRRIGVKIIFSTYIKGYNLFFMQRMKKEWRWGNQCSIEFEGVVRAYTYSISIQW